MKTQLRMVPDGSDFQAGKGVGAGTEGIKHKSLHLMCLL